MLEPLYRESRRLFSSGDSVRCSFGLEPLLRSLLKLKPRSRSRGGLPAATAWSMLLMAIDWRWHRCRSPSWLSATSGDGTGVCCRESGSRVGERAERWPSCGFSVERALGSRSNEWLALRGGDICATAQRYGIGGVQGEIDGEKQGEGELQFCPEGLGRNSCRRRARCRVARGCPRGPEPSATTGWWLEALALDGTSSSANANRQ